MAKVGYPPKKRKEKEAEETEVRGPVVRTEEMRGLWVSSAGMEGRLKKCLCRA